MERLCCQQFFKKGNYLPANPIHVAVYLQHVLESTQSCSSVDSALYAIKWAHEIAGMASPRDNQVVSRVREAAKRILGAGKANRKEPISTDVLKDIVDSVDLSNILHFGNVCLYVLAYAGFFRSEEVLDIRMNHIYFQEGCMIIKVEKRNTDQLRQGDQVVIAQSGGSVCPVFLLKTDPHSNEFIFRQLVKTKSSHKLTQKNKPISYTTFRDQLAKSLQNVVPDPSAYGTHSFRSGGASRAANSGVSDRLFQRHGGRVLQLRTATLRMTFLHDFQSRSLWVSSSFSLLIKPYTFSSR